MGARRAGSIVVAAMVAGLALLAAAPEAAGQGVPAWAPRVAASVDAGNPTATVIHSDTNRFSDVDGGPREDFFDAVFGFVLGFNPLEPSLEELARKADAGQVTPEVLDGGFDDAGAVADAGETSMELDGSSVTTPVANGPDAGSATP